jgi:hypothetical protein
LVSCNSGSILDLARPFLRRLRDRFDISKPPWLLTDTKQRSSTFSYHLGF